MLNYSITLVRKKSMTSFDYIYRELVSKVLNTGFEEFNERTKLKTRIITGVHLDIESTNFPVLTLRKIPLKLFVAEQIWYLQGDNDLSFFQKFSRIWDDFKEDDNTVESGYGYRWRKFFSRDQVASLLEMFRKEKSSRQGVVVTWDPNSDGLASAKKKNVPCVPLWIANIVDDKLNFHVVFRSNDVMLGLPHDVAGFALLQHILAQELGLEPGWLHYSISHAHIYENHYEQARLLLERKHEHEEVRLALPDKCYERALAKDQGLVLEIVSNIEKQYQPLPSLGKMQIAL
jgi:thymidylate synthase